MPFPSTLTQLYVKVVHANTQTDNIDRQESNYHQQTIPIVLVRYQKTILVLDFNICALLKVTN